MGATYSIYRRELGTYFNTPIGYVFMIFFLIVTRVMFVFALFSNGVAEMRGYFGLMPIFLMFFVPAVSMRLWAEERKMGTLELLLTMPLKTWHAVVGKYLAGLTFIGIWFVFTLDIPLVLRLYGNPDLGTIACGYIGTMVLAMIYLAIGMFASSLTSDQIIAYVIGVSLNLVFWLMGYPMILDFIRDKSEVGADIVARFGIDYHFESITRGVLDSRDVIYALTLTGLFLLLNILVIERRR